ncbi:MAG: FHA domain-containing protein [Lachnospiraceae bacterium]|nr:FHA domain-containing protein [Lachnospiraceae bacterium]
MLVKAKDKQISFLFQELDPFFEIGCRILEQEHMDQMLPYRRSQQNGREKLIFQAEGENTVRLINEIPKFGEARLVDLLYEMIYLNKKVEENGFLKKECIWYKYDNIYFNRDKDCFMVAVLPITGEFRYADDTGWYDQFEDTVKNIVSFLPPEKAEYAKKIVRLLKSGKVQMEEALAEIGYIGCKISGYTGVDSGLGQKVMLKLLYIGKSGRLEFLVGDNDFLIGRNPEAVDGVITLEMSKAVSRKHCLITKMNQKYFVQDLESVNHTLVNGIMIPPYELMELENNDILSVGDIEFRVTTNNIDCRIM